MKFSTFYSAVGAVALSFSVHGQILVGGSGAGPIAFGATPPLPAAEWATSTTGVGSGGAGGLNTPEEVATAAQTLNQASIANALATTTATGTSAGARHHTSVGYLLTQPTTVAALVLKATLRNDSGQQISHIDVGYDFGVRVASATESAPGHQAFFSTNGQAGSWEPIPAFSGLNAAAAVSATLFVGVWEPNADIYLLWVDDNNATTADAGYSIDNFAVSSVVTTNFTVPLSVVLGTPADGQIFVAPANVTASAIPGGTVPATSVSFFTNGVLAATVVAPGPFSAALNELPAGTYAIYAEADNGVDPTATSATSTITVRPQFVEYTGGTYVQDFDSMTPTGTQTPDAWYVGFASPINGFVVTVDDGSTAPSGSIAGFNYGGLGAPDRSLGTAPTSTGAPAGHRNVTTRIRNNTISNLVSFEILFDAEQWRVNTSNTWVEVLTNYVSFDGGTNWVATGFDFISPVVAPPGGVALDGKDPLNRVTALGGVISPPLPIAPGGVVHVRWHNFNDPGTDGGMAIDNFSFTGTEFTETVLALAILNPTNGQSFAGGCVGAADITVNAAAATVVGQTVMNVAFQLDGGAAVDDDTAPFSTVLAGVPVGPHTITVTATDTAGGIATTSVTVSVTANLSPSVAITNTFCFTTNSPEYLVGCSITNDIALSDDVGITNVTFLVNGAVHLVRTTATGRVVVNDALAGLNTYHVVATDTCGLSVTSAPVVINVTNPPVLALLVTNGTTWRYDNTSNDLGVAWIDVSYDDSLWAAGPGDLGDNGAGENTPARTIIDIGAGTRIPTIYFRHFFNVASTAGITNLILSVLRDDGVAVYFNGNTTAVYRNNLAANAGWGTFASAQAADDGRTYQRVNIDPTNLVAGLNVIAVEVHNANATSSDLTFDLMLWAEAATMSNLAIALDGLGNVVITPAVSGNLVGSTEVAAPVNTWTFIQAVTEGVPVTLPHDLPYRFFVLVP